MRSVVVAERYTLALYEVAEKEGTVDRLSEEAKSLLAILEKDPRLIVLLRSPQITAEQRKEFSKKAFRSASALLLRMILLLIDKHRIDYLPQILAIFQKEYERRRGVLIARLTTARPLGDDVTSRLRERLERRLQRKVQLQVEEDQGVIGGFIFITETLLIDASLKRQLAMLQTQLVSHA